MKTVSELTPAGYTCLDTIQEIVTKLGGSREICLAIASLGNSHSDEGVLAELRHRSALLDNECTPKCAIDMRDLLKRYMHHVGHCEGICFLSPGHRIHGDFKFTDSEWQLLLDLQDETGGTE